MMTVRRSSERGYANHGWLDTFHTFSFAHYHDPDHMGFGFLRVLNQDQVAPGQGFGTHGHRDMEIVSYVLDGVLEHRDSMGHGSQMMSGDVQLMSAGTGVTHSEFNASKEEPLHLLQMWIIPREKGTTPRYEQKRFERSELEGRLRLVVAPHGEEGALTIGQDAFLYAGCLDGEQTVEHRLLTDRSAWFHLARGSVRLSGIDLEAGDGVAISDEASLRLDRGSWAEFVLWDLPKKRS